MAYANVVVAAGFLIFRRVSSEVQYLLLQTSYGEHHWTPPKGHVDPGEDEMQTAYRETKEEAGLDVEQLNLIKNFKKELKYDVQGKPKKVIYWLSELKDPNTPVTLSDEHQSYKWLKLEDAVQFAKYPEMRKVLKDADNYIQKFIIKN
ncbi:hypothetical protein CHS0354_021498 [Potamilus streckersoni]|uniref:Bis(5'-nucleosyl)-tetraphosphatase [asymmetrical] n=1 Tax=Potamilus streckersoni TaxID=2493646 RepID=A0AAE0VTP4_9BIVA|nr:hypothetical protein CHS0354_021498 [Potamilus streckersoni]